MNRLKRCRRRLMWRSPEDDAGRAPFPTMVYACVKHMHSTEGMVTGG